MNIVTNPNNSGTMAENKEKITIGTPVTGICHLLQIGRATAGTDIRNVGRVQIFGAGNQHSNFQMFTGAAETENPKLFRP